MPMQFPWGTDPSHVTLGLAGDIMLGRLVNEFMAEMQPEYTWGNLLPFLKSTDLNLINLENAFTLTTEKVPKVFNFKADPKHVKSLNAGSIQVVNLANNHSLDFTRQGLFDTLHTLDQNNIAHVGAGENIEKAKFPAKFNVKGLKIGILGCTDNEPSWLATENHAGTFYLNVGDMKTIEKDIAKLRKEVDILILSIHWGPNMRERPNGSFVKFAHALIDCGVDVLHGHSAHIFQGIELYNGGLILYDCGDFVDDYAVDPFLRNDYTFLFIVEVAARGKYTLYLIPSLISDFQVNRAEGKDLLNIVGHMKELSSEFNTPLTYQEKPFPYLKTSIVFGL